MTKPNGYVDNDYHGPPTKPNPGKDGAELGQRELNYGLANAILDDRWGAGSSLLNILPIVPVEQGAAAPAPENHNHTMADYHWGASEAQWLDHAWRMREHQQDDTVDALRGAFAQARQSAAQANHDQITMMARRMNQRVNDLATNALMSGDHATPPNLATRLNRIMNQRLINGDRTQFFGDFHYGNPEVVMQDRKRQVAQRFTDHQMTVPAWATNLDVELGGRPLNRYSPDGWAIVSRSLEEALDQARKEALDSPPGIALTPAGEEILHRRQRDIVNRCHQLGIPVDMVLEPNREQFLFGRPIVQYGESHFRQMLDSMYTWICTQLGRPPTG